MEEYADGFRVIASTQQSAMTDDSFDSYDEYIIIETKDKATVEMVNTMAVNSFSRSCDCSYDCCGHWFTRVWTHQTSKIKGENNKYLVVLHHAANV
jgi:hypothetical protein